LSCLWSWFIIVGYLAGPGHRVNSGLGGNLHILLSGIPIIAYFCLEVYFYAGNLRILLSGNLHILLSGNPYIFLFDYLKFFMLRKEEIPEEKGAG
jgi:hypothetical protein